VLTGDIKEEEEEKRSSGPSLPSFKSEKYTFWKATLF
jgi:hypothetical protein